MNIICSMFDRRLSGCPAFVDIVEVIRAGWVADDAVEHRAETVTRPGRLYRSARGCVPGCEVRANRASRSGGRGRGIPPCRNRNRKGPQGWGEVPKNRLCVFLWGWLSGYGVQAAGTRASGPEKMNRHLHTYPAKMERSADFYILLRFRRYFLEDGR